MPLLTEIPTFSDDQLTLLEDIQPWEVTLCKRPALGTPGQFRILKSLDKEPVLQFSAEIAKVDQEKRQVFGYPLVPSLPDFQGDIVTKAQVEAAAHNFMRALAKRSQEGEGVGKEHVEFGSFAHPIESTIDHDGAHGVAGGWWFGVQIVEDAVWQEVLKGDITGFSIGGQGERKKASGKDVLQKTHVEVYALVFPKKTSPDVAKKWAKDNKYKFTRKSSRIEGSFRVVEQRPEADFQAGTFRRILLEKGVEAIVAISKTSIGQPGPSLMIGARMQKALEDLELDELRWRAADALREAERGDQEFYDSCCIIALFSDRVVYSRTWRTTSDLWQRTYSINADNTVALGDAQSVKRQFVAIEKALWNSGEDEMTADETRALLADQNAKMLEAIQGVQKSLEGDASRSTDMQGWGPRGGKGARSFDLVEAANRINSGAMVGKGHAKTFEDDGEAGAFLMLHTSGELDALKKTMDENNSKIAEAISKLTEAVQKHSDLIDALAKATPGVSLVVDAADDDADAIQKSDEPDWGNPILGINHPNLHSAKK